MWQVGNANERKLEIPCYGLDHRTRASGGILSMTLSATLVLSEDFKQMERETRFELATSTLARLRSTS